MHHLRTSPTPSLLIAIEATVAQPGISCASLAARQELYPGWAICLWALRSADAAPQY